VGGVDGRDGEGKGGDEKGGREKGTRGGGDLGVEVWVRVGLEGYLVLFDFG
jgi:hypothetical protein